MRMSCAVDVAAQPDRAASCFKGSRHSCASGPYARSSVYNNKIIKCGLSTCATCFCRRQRLSSIRGCIGTCGLAGSKNGTIKAPGGLIGHVATTARDLAVSVTYRSSRLHHPILERPASFQRDLQDLAVAHRDLVLDYLRTLGRRLHSISFPI